MADANNKCKVAGLEQVFKSQYCHEITDPNAVAVCNNSDIAFLVQKGGNDYVTFEQVQENLLKLSENPLPTTTVKYTQFSDIPMFMEEGSYTADMPFEQLIHWIDNEKANRNLQLDPDFQRGHVWTEEQQIAFIEFILRGGNSGKVLYFNDPSWKRKATTNYNDFVCVDGLQRITAIQRFMNNEIPVFGSFYREYTDPLPILVANMKVNVNNLQTKADVLRWYIEMNSGGTVHSAEEINRVKAMLAQIV